MNNMKLKNRYSRFNFDGFLDAINVSLGMMGKKFKP
jgi:hypothetical protein